MGILRFQFGAKADDDCPLRRQCLDTGGEPESGTAKSAGERDCCFRIGPLGRWA